MRRGVASLVFVIPLLATLILFQPCFVPFAKAHETPSYQRPVWAVNKYGNIDLYISDLNTVIDYNPNESYSTTYTLSYKSSLFTGGGKYRVSYEIISSVLGVIDRGSIDIEEASYESTLGVFNVLEGDIKSFNLEIPKGLEGLEQVRLIVDYNISGLKTKINIPIDVQKPASGTVLINETPIFYSASPIIPSSNKARLEVSSRRIVVIFNISDLGGCFSGYRRPPTISYNVKLIYAGREVNIVSCNPSSLRSFPAQITCSINVDGDEGVKSAFNSKAGVHLELNLDIGPYDCVRVSSYTIQVRKYT